MKTRSNLVQLASNIAGALGYFSILMQWLWLAIVLLPGLLANDQFKSFFLTEPSHQSQEVATQATSSSPLLMVVVGIITVAVILVTIYILFKVPNTIAKSGHKITQEATEAALPFITHHKKVSKKKKNVLVFRISFIFKYIIALLGYLLLLIPPSGEHVLDGGIIWAIGTIFVASAIFWFGVQFAIAKVFSLDPETLL